MLSQIARQIMLLAVNNKDRKKYHSAKNENSVPRKDNSLKILVFALCYP